MNRLRSTVPHLALVAILGLGGTAAAEKGHDRIEYGEAALVADSEGNELPVVTWAVITPENDIEEVGVTVPVALFENQPTVAVEHGTLASLDYPALVQELTYLNHFDIGSQPDGHEAPRFFVNPDRNRVPHFDFHFYSIPKADVSEIPEIRPWPNPLLPDVAPERLPPGYIQPVFSAHQMGRHANPVWSVNDPGTLSTVMLAGFLPDGSEMHFIEPMVSRERLLQRNDFKLPMPMPEEFGQTMLYPTKFEAEYDRDLDAYNLVFSKFVLVE